MPSAPLSGHTGGTPGWDGPGRGRHPAPRPRNGGAAPPRGLAPAPHGPGPGALHNTAAPWPPLPGRPRGPGAAPGLLSFLPSFLPRDLCVLFYLGLVACISPPCVALGGGVSHREGCRGREQRETEAGMKEKEEAEETRDLIRALRQNWDAVTFCVSVSDFDSWQEPCVSGDATQEWLQSWFLHQ